MGGSKPASIEDPQFVEWINTEMQDIDSRTASEVYGLSFEAYYRLVTIHPWSDGNGRM